MKEHQTPQLLLPQEGHTPPTHLGSALGEGPADHPRQERAAYLIFDIYSISSKSQPRLLEVSLPPVGGCQRSGAGGAPKAFCSPRNCTGKQSKTKQTLSFPKTSPVRPQRGGRSSASDFQRLAGRQRVKYARCFPVMHFSQMFKTYERRVVKTHII